MCFTYDIRDEQSVAKQLLCAPRGTRLRVLSLREEEFMDKRLGGLKFRRRISRLGLKVVGEERRNSEVDVWRRCTSYQRSVRGGKMRNGIVENGNLA
jgi:hypothetical protein